MTERARDAIRLSWGALLQASLILSTCSMGFAYLKAQTQNNAHQIAEQKILEEKKWVKNDTEFAKVNAELKSVREIQIDVRLGLKETQTQYANILRELEQVNAKLDNGGGSDSEAGMESGLQAG
jgi:septal ring factor EnvC (AmiA/AmiB activator)